jgi:hypothetical protein
LENEDAKREIAEKNQQENNEIAGEGEKAKIDSEM